MIFSLDKSLQILQRTPHVLSLWLTGLDDEWIINNTGAGTWSVKDVVAHLIICEKTNWLTRAKIIIADGPDKVFTPIDMVSHLELSKNSTLARLLQEFTVLRENTLKELKNLNLHEDDWKKTARHLQLGEVNLQQLTATWVAHDLSHIAQVSKIMAMQYRENVGPFITFLKFLNKD